MTFEEKKMQYMRTEILDFVTKNRIGHQDESLAFQTASMAFDKARQETLREVLPAMKFLLHCVNQTTWIAEGPRDIKNPMFLGTGSVDGDQEVHDKYISAKELLKKLEAEREASDV